MEQWVKTNIRNRGYSGTEEQWVHRKRGIRGTDEQWVKRNRGYSGTVGKEEYWEQWLQRNSGYREAGEHLSQR